MTTAIRIDKVVQEKETRLDRQKYKGLDLLVRTVPEKKEARKLVRFLSKSDDLCLAPLELCCRIRSSSRSFLGGTLRLGQCGWWRPNTNCGSLRWVQRTQVEEIGIWLAELVEEDGVTRWKREKGEERGA